ncbi:MAG: hypothetical protein H7101_03570, partial [Deinococcales bacterium]|nr:hypothetical protein [Chitinophagaceae bacterium]
MKCTKTSFQKIHQQYRIVVECKNRTTKLALAGFCAEEQTEATLFRYLYNMCLLSDGSLVSTHGLLCGVLQQWQNTLSIPSAQLLKSVAFESPLAKLQALCLYRTKVGEEEKLINR